MDRLEAINICLRSLGEPSISSLDGAGIDAQVAADTVDEISRQLQLKGWSWNKEFHDLTPDIDNQINLPSNTARVITIYSSVDAVARGLRLFNRDTNSYTFDAPISVALIVLLPFDDLPLAARDCIAAIAADTLQERVLGSDSLDRYLERKQLNSWAELIRDETLVAKPNILKDNWSTYSIIQRSGFSRGAYL